MFATVCISSIGLHAVTIDEIPNVHLLDRTKFLSDQSGKIGKVATAKVDSMISDIWRKTTAEVIVVVVDSITGETDVDTFATELYELWGIGKKDNDNGLLVFVSLLDRAVVIRTGYGMEGIVTDLEAGRIIRNDMFPLFRQNDYEGGLIAGLEKLHSLITDDKVKEELISQYANDAETSDNDIGEIWKVILYGGIIILIASIIYVWWCAIRFNHDSRKQWEKLQAVKLPLLVLTFLLLGTPVISYLLVSYRAKRLRNKPPLCDNCSTKMSQISIERKLRYLNASQTTEERLKSIEHDVWVCDSCNSVKVLSYNNNRSPYTTCLKCGTKSYHQVSDVILREPTTVSTGLGRHFYRCEYCGDSGTHDYVIPRKTPVIITTGGGRGFGGGGGFSGGSFGGGHTGGGGASGRW